MEGRKLLNQLDISSLSVDNTDSNDRRIVPELQFSEIRSHKDTWIRLLSNPSTTTHKSHDTTHKSHDSISKSHDSISKSHDSMRKSHDPVVHLFPSLKSAIQWLSRDPDYSLYLVGNSFFYLKEKF